jgi:hypothetical protein
MSTHAPSATTFVGRATRVPRNSPLRWIAILALLTAAAAHVPVIPPHLREAPYIGVLFILLVVVCIALSAALAVTDSGTVWAITVLVGALAVLAYVVSRTVGLPQIGDDIGNWGEPLGVVSIAAESAAALCGIATMAILGPRSASSLSRSPGDGGRPA